MKREIVLKIVREHDGNPDALIMALGKAVDAGDISYDDVDEAIGIGSNLYPAGYPELCDMSPDWWVQYLAEKRKAAGERVILL